MRNVKHVEFDYGYDNEPESVHKFIEDVEEGFGEQLNFDQLLPEKQQIVWDGLDVLDVGFDEAGGNVEHLIES